MSNTINVAICAPFRLYFSENEEKRVLSLVTERFGAAEGERIASINNKSSRLLSLGALCSLSALLGESDYKIERSKTGKPYFTDVSKGCFSLAHAGELAVAVFAESEIGIDIELISDNRGFCNIAKRFFTLSELTGFEASGKRVESFFEIWTKKEAYVKYCGKTFVDLYSQDPRDVVFESFLIGFGRENYVMTICSKKKNKIVTKLLDEDVKIIEGE